MKTIWPLQDAKNRFSEVVEVALTKGPQWVTRRGREAVVVVSAKEFVRRNKVRESLAEFFHKSPLQGLDLDGVRSRDTGRPVDL